MTNTIYCENRKTCPKSASPEASSDIRTPQPWLWAWQCRALVPAQKLRPFPKMQTSDAIGEPQGWLWPRRVQRLFQSRALPRLLPFLSPHFIHSSCRTFLNQVTASGFTGIWIFVKQECYVHKKMWQNQWQCVFPQKNNFIRKQFMTKI